MTEKLKGKSILVTGGGRGLGEAVTLCLAQAGARVLVVDIQYELASSVAKRVVERGGIAESWQVDLTSAEEARAAIQEIVRRFGAIDVLINNAGVDLTAPIVEFPLEQWDRILATNLRAPFVLSQAALIEMRRQGGGHIVNIVSTAAKRAWPNASAYHASKWGLLGFSHALHVEARKDKVKVTAVISGGMRTPFLTERFPDLDLDLLQDPMNVAETILFVLTQKAETVIPEIMVLPMRETSWP